MVGSALQEAALSLPGVSKAVLARTFVSKADVTIPLGDLVFVDVPEAGKSFTDSGWNACH
jgi:hypothetical protein